MNTAPVNGRVALGSLLATVTNAANMVSSTVNVMADTVNMAGGFVSKHRQMQDQRNVIDLDTFTQRLIKDKARENVAHDEDINKWLSSDNTRKTNFIAEAARLQNLLNPQANTATAEA